MCGGLFFMCGGLFFIIAAAYLSVELPLITFVAAILLVCGWYFVFAILCLYFFPLRLLISCTLFAVGLPLLRALYCLL